MRLHQWAFATASWRAQQGLDGGERGVDCDVVEEVVQGVGAYIMGRRMFGGGEGSWDSEWTGWWGDDPPYHVPVFVLTHHERDPLTMRGGATFTFVTEGVESALERARTAAAGRDVAIAGGASTVREYLRLGALDELYLHIVPVILGARRRSHPRTDHGDRLAVGHARQVPRCPLSGRTPPQPRCPRARDEVDAPGMRPRRGASSRACKRSSWRSRPCRRRSCLPCPRFACSPLRRSGPG
jgi:dihydrofolate reductase